VWEGQLSDASFGGVRVELLGVEFGSRTPPVLQLGQEVVLSFSFTGVSQPVRARAVVVSRTDHGENRYYGFRFTNQAQFESQLSTRLYGLFNRRRAYRVQPQTASDSAVHVAIEPQKGRLCVRGQAADLSVTGVGVRAPLKTEAALARTDHVTVTLSLPESTETLRLAGVIRHRRVVSVTTAHYGIEFDFERSPEAEKQQGMILAYVMQRQRAMRSLE
jgi:hypothetical protein